MAASRFHFLEEDFPGLYEICVQAEQASEYNEAMMEIRRALETIVRDLGAQSKELFRGINELEGREILNRDTSRRFHALRRIVNHKDHGKEMPDKADILPCLEQLLRLTVVYGLKQEKTYGLEQFSLDDVPVVRSYLAKAGMLPEETVEAGAEDNWSVDPLRLEDPRSISPISRGTSEFACDVFETEEEFEQRIAAMAPVYIGCALLDGRKKDEYTGVIFLIHHIDHNEDIKLSSIDAFYTKEQIADEVIDGELVAKLKVHEDKVCCDYSQVYLRHGDEFIAVQSVCWDKLFYENKEKYENRISSMPLLPFGIGQPVRREYDLTTEMLPFVINPFQYAGKIFKDLMSANKRVNIRCSRDIAKKLCDVQGPCVLFLKLHTVEAVAKSILWRNDVGEIAENNYRDALDWYQKGADKGYAPAQKNLGNCYWDGEGVEQDYKKAAAWYRKSADQGYAKAQNNLGNCYYNGWGVEKDYSKAVEWYRKAANQGNALAQEQLGTCYYNGRGVDKDYSKAVEWYRKAAAQGRADAQNRLGNCYYWGNGVDEDNGKAVEWYLKAAEQGNAEAQNSLGVCYDHGYGVEENKVKAVDLFIKAADKGSAWAQHNLGLYYQYGRGGLVKNREKAIEYYQKAAEQGKDDEKLQKSVQGQLAKI